MLKYIIPTVILIPLTWLSKGSIIWINSTTHSLLISLTSLLLINQFSDNSLNFSSVFFFWLPVSTTINSNFVASSLNINSQSALLVKRKPDPKKTVYYYTNSTKTISIITFTAIELIFFYILFEATLVPTLLLLNEWIKQNA